MMDPETKSRVSGVNNNKGGGGPAKNEKFVKTMKKLPDVKMGHLEGKNLTFSSDSEDPNNNFVRAFDLHVKRIGESTTND
jgi:hypothetical protein